MRAKGCTGIRARGWTRGGILVSVRVRVRPLLTEYTLYSYTTAVHSGACPPIQPTCLTWSLPCGGRERDLDRTVQYQLYGMVQLYVRVLYTQNSLHHHPHESCLGSILSCLRMHSQPTRYA